MTGVFLFIQTGCGACHEYMPRFQYIVGSLAGRVPVGVYDLAKSDKRVGEFATRLSVKVTPTTVVLSSDGNIHKREGALSNDQLRELLRRAR